MLKLLSVTAALVAALSLVAGPALAGQDKHAPQDKPVSGSIGQGNPSFEHVHALAVTADGRTLLLGAHSGLFRSEDEGRSWQPVALPSKHPHVDVMAVMPHLEDARAVYVATHEAGVFKTTDGGTSWQEANAGLGGADVHGLAIDPRDPQKLHAAVRDKGEGIYRSTDGGAKWVRVDDGPGGEVKVLASVNISTGMGGIFVYAGTAAGLQRNPDCF
jgi:photosystem II stability/assembly factor-like uncharacterized protein